VAASSAALVDLLSIDVSHNNVTHSPIGSINLNELFASPRELIEELVKANRTQSEASTSEETPEKAEDDEVVVTAVENDEDSEGEDEGEEDDEEEGDEVDEEGEDEDEVEVEDAASVHNNEEVMSNQMSPISQGSPISANGYAPSPYTALNVISNDRNLLSLEKLEQLVKQKVHSRKFRE
jgi:hypothetical protein